MLIFSVVILAYYSPYYSPYDVISDGIGNPQGYAPARPPTSSCLVIACSMTSSQHLLITSSSIFICRVSLRHIYFYHTYSPSAESAYVIPIFPRLRRHLKQYKKATQDSFHPFISRTAATTLLLTGKQQHGRTKQSSAYRGTLP